MNPLDPIRKFPSDQLRNRDVLAAIEREVLLLDEDDRNHACYEWSMRLRAEGLLDEAERFTRWMITWPIERGWFLGDIALDLWRVGQAPRAFELLDEAILLARTSGREWQRAEALSRLATTLIDMGQSERAIALLLEAVPIAQLGQQQGYGHDIEDSAGVIRELAVKLAALGEHEQALQAAHSVEHSIKREGAVGRVQAIIRNHENQ